MSGLGRPRRTNLGFRFDAGTALKPVDSSTRTSMHLSQVTQLRNSAAAKRNVGHLHPAMPGMVR